MSFIRPDVREMLGRWAEPATGVAILLFGIWCAAQGGVILLALGIALAALGLGWAVLGVRRMRFRHAPGAPGLVELDEGRLRYIHPAMGGEVSIPDLAEIQLLTLRGRRVWRLRDLQGQALLVPVDAAGAADLFDAFSSLPGLSSADLLAALQDQDASAAAGGGSLPIASDTVTRRVWSRKGQGLRRV